MKKIYTLSLLMLCVFTSFAQTFYSENFGTPASNTAVGTYTGYQVGTPVIYSGTGATVRTSNNSGGAYDGASGSGNVFFNTGHIFMIEGLNTSSYAAADLVLSFGLKQDNASPAAPASDLTLEKSIDGTAWTAIPYSRTATGTAWELITIGGGNIPSTPNLRLRFTQNGSTTQYRIDDVKLSSVSASCTLALGSESKLCNASTLSMDTYTVTIPFTGGGTATYGITATQGTIGGDNPTTATEGNITISGITEGNNITVTVTSGTCTLDKNVIGISCKPVNTLPYVDSFNYTAGESLGDSQRWTSANTGDNVTVIPGNLNYTGVNSTGSSVSFSGTGAEAYSPFTAVSTGTIYTSFLMNVTDMTNVTTEGTDAYFMGLLKSNDVGGYNVRLFAKKVGTQYQLGFDSTSTTTNYTTASYNVGDTVLIIIGFDYTTSTYNLWVNPTVSTFTTASTPTLTKTVTGTAIPTDFGGFILRQDAANNTPTITIDEVRIGTSASDILTTKSFNEISGLKLYPNPLTGNVLNVTSNNSADKTIAVYDVLGKNVLNATVTNETVNVAGLNGGVYIVKITEEGKTATRKLVIK